MFKQILNGSTYFLLFMICLMLADFYKHPLFLLLLMLLITFIPISYYVCKNAFHRLVLDVSFQAAFGSSTDKIPISIQMHSNAFVPLPDCKITYRISSPFYPCEDIRQVIAPAFARGSFIFSLPVHFERAGIYELNVLELSCYDYLHIFRFRKDISLQKELMIYPRVIELPAFDQTAYGEGFDEFEETSAKGNVSSNVTDIREYVPGDRLQKIHWKLSLKIDKLMIKENEATATNQFSMLVELYQNKPESDCLERALTYAYSLALRMSESGEPFFFVVYSVSGHDFIQTLIRCREDLESAMTECFYQTTYREEDLALHTLLNASTLQGILLHVTHKGVENVIS